MLTPQATDFLYGYTIHLEFGIGIEIIIRCMGIKRGVMKKALKYFGFELDFEDGPLNNDANEGHLQELGIYNLYGDYIWLYTNCRNEWRLDKNI